MTRCRPLRPVSGRSIRIEFKSNFTITAESLWTSLPLRERRFGCGVKPMNMNENGVMPADRSGMDRNGSIARELRRQAASPENRRQLRRLPQFRVENELSEELRTLLRKLDAAQGRSSRRG